jgi:hypothetical protein
MSPLDAATLLASHPAEPPLCKNSAPLASEMNTNRVRPFYAISDIGLAISVTRKTHIWRRIDLLSHVPNLILKMQAWKPQLPGFQISKRTVLLPRFANGCERPPIEGFSRLGLVDCGRKHIPNTWIVSHTCFRLEPAVEFVRVTFSELGNGFDP